MLLKKRLLRKFALPTDCPSSFGVMWTRPNDLFGDHFALLAQVEEDHIHFDYRHRPYGCQEESTLWSFTIALTSSGRARVDACQGIYPEVKTVYRAVDLVDKATKHLQTNPSLMRHHGSEFKRCF